MAAKLDILITAKNQTGGAIGQIKSALGGLQGAAVGVAAAAGVAAVGAVTAITGAVAVGVNKAIDMEQRVADIASVMGVTYDEAKPLADLITNLGIDPKLKVDAGQAADAIQNLAANGLSMTQILDGAARSTVLLANATGADFGTAANVATDAMSLFKISAEDMKGAVDGIAGVTVASKFGINDYALALAQGGGVASAAGVDFADFNATIAAISPYFAGGSDAGTSFKVMLQRLIPSSNEAEAAMKQLGLITEDGKNQFFDANGQMRSMQEISGMLQGALGGLSEEQKNAALSTIFGSDAMRAAVALAETGSDKFGVLRTQIAGVNSEAQAATRMNTLSGQLEILQGVVDGLLTQIGQSFLPLLRGLANWATDFATQNGPMVVAWFNGLAQRIETIIPVIQGWARTFAGALNEIAAWVNGQSTTFENLNRIWAGLWTGLGQIVGNAFNALVKLAVEWLPNFSAEMGKWAATGYLWVTNNMLPNVLAGMGSAWGELNKWIATNHPEWMPWIDSANSFIEGVKKGWADNLPGLSAAFETFVTDLQGSLGRLRTAFADLFGGDGKPGELAEQGARLADALSWVGKSILNTLVGLVDGVATSVEALVKMREAWEALQRGDFMGAMGILGQINQMMNDLKMRDVFGEAGLQREQADWLMELVRQQQAGATTNNTYNVNVQGNGNSGEDVMSNVLFLQQLYGGR